MSWAGSVLSLGALLGAIMGGFLIDKYGRKVVLVATSVPSVIGWFLLIFAIDSSKKNLSFRLIAEKPLFYLHNKIGMLYIGRALIGFVGGLSTVVCPVYIGIWICYWLYSFQLFHYLNPKCIGEITTPKMRGPLGCVLQAMICLGLVVSSLLGLYLDWRLISAALAVPSLLLPISVMYFPETPYYLLKQGIIFESTH